jgi:hypothetical protein
MTEETQNEAVETPEVPADSLLVDAPKALDFAQGRPEEFPEEFWDAEKATVDANKLAAAWQQEKKRAEGLRVKLSKGEFEGKAPADVSEYKLELSDELKAIAPDDDRLMAKAREAAKEAGLPKEAFSKMMLPLIQEVAALQAELTKPPSQEEIQAAKTAELEKLGPNGAAVVQAVNSYIDSLTTTGKFSQAEAAVIRSMATSAESIKVLNKFRMMTNPSSVPVNLPVTDTSSREEISNKMAKAALAGDEIEYKKYSKLLQQAG